MSTLKFQYANLDEVEKAAKRRRTQDSEANKMRASNFFEGEAKEASGSDTETDTDLEVSTPKKGKEFKLRYVNNKFYIFNL